MTNQKKLTAFVLAALAVYACPCGNPASAAEKADDHATGAVDTYELDPVDVEGRRESIPGGMVQEETKLGVLGAQSIFTVPYSEMSMTEKMIETYNDPSQPLANVLLNNPSIRSSTSSPMYSDFSMRGINMNGNHMMLNGVPSLYSQFTTPPSHVIARMDITSGPNAAVNGVSMSNNGTNGGATPAPGTINIVTKRAGDVPVTRYTQVVSGRGTFGEYIDVGRRFGRNEAWGLRVNGELLHGKMSLKDGEMHNSNIFFNLDHRDDRSSTNLFAGVFDQRVDGAQRWFTYTGNTAKLPTVPDAATPYDFKETTKRMWGHILTLNHEQKIDARYTAFFNLGFSRRDGEKYNSGASLAFDANGNFVGSNKANAQHEAARNVYLQAGIKGTAVTGAVHHDFALSVDRSWAKYWNANNWATGSFYSGNLYDGISFLPGFTVPSYKPYLPQWEELNVGVTLVDAMRVGKWNVLLAASQKHEHFKNITSGKTFENTNILPTWGLTYRPTDRTSIYYGHTESFSRGAVVVNSSNKTYVNAGATLEPVRSRQNEIGVKHLAGGVLSTLSFFEIDEPNLIDVPLGGTNYRRAADGKNRYRGIEYTANGKPHAKWTVTGGLLYLDAERVHTAGGTKDGAFVAGAAQYSGVVGLTYEPTDACSFTGRLVWSDKAYIENTSGKGKIEIPAYATVDLGMTYKMRINTVPTKLSLMCYNALNKSYWMGRGGSSTFGLSMPRTWMFSAQFDI